MSEQTILDYLKINLNAQRATLDEDSFLIRGVWKVHCIFQPSEKERVFRYVFLISQTVNQGCAYCVDDHYEVQFLQSLMGRSYFDLTIEDRCLDISLLDAIYASLPRRPTNTVTLTGNSLEKAIDRARLVVDEATRLLSNRRHVDTAPTVVNVGVVGHIIDELLNRGYHVFATDLDPSLQGQKFLDRVVVHPGNKTLHFVASSDVAIVTGMTLSTDTLDSIISTAKAHDTKLVVFAETGSSFAPAYLQLGVDCVIAEPFPFYIFQGATLIEVYRNATPNASE